MIINNYNSYFVDKPAECVQYQFSESRQNSKLHNQKGQGQKQKTENIKNKYIGWMKSKMG